MGICIVSSLTEAEWTRASRGFEEPVPAPGEHARDWEREVHAKHPTRYVRNDPPQLRAHPLPAMPRETPRHYHDPAKSRTVEQVRAELGKVLAKHLAGADVRDWLRDKCRIVVETRRTIVPGWTAEATDGCTVIVGRDATRSDQPGLCNDPGQAVHWGRLEAEGWRDYAPVRVLRHPRSGAVRWTRAPGRLTWATGGDDTATSWTSLVNGVVRWDADPREATVLLADGYTWPLRGRSWDLTYWPQGDSGALQLTDVETGALGVVIMGMRG